MLKRILFVMVIGLAAFLSTGCSQEETAPPKQPDVEVKTMEEIGKLTPEEEAKAIREKDERASEDKAEGGI